MLRILSPVALGLALTACGGDGEAPEAAPPTEARPQIAPADTTPGEVAAPGRVLVTLEEQERSGISGTAELTPDDGDTLVVVVLDDPDAVHASAYLQEGDCTAVRPEAAEVLALFLDGRSETHLDVELTNLLNGRFVIALYDDEEPELQRPAACGEIRPEGS